MTSLVLLSLILAQPVVKEVKLVVHPAAPPQPLLRVQLWPSLTEQVPGDALVLLTEATKTLKALNLSGIEDEIREDAGAPVQKTDVARLKVNLASVQKVLDLLDRAACCQVCDWGETTKQLRTKGINTILEVVQDLRRVVPLLAARARLELLEDRPQDAIRSIGRGLRLAQRCSECPTLISHLAGVALFAIVIEQLDVVIAHPKCPNLYWALTSLPTPLMSLRTAMEGERTSVAGTFPKLMPYYLDPTREPPGDDEMKAIVLAGQTFFDSIGMRVNELDRVRAGFAIQFKHEMAVKELIAAGYPADRVKQWPPLLVASVHALLDYEEKLGRIQLAMQLPYIEARRMLDKIDAEMKDRRATTEAKSPAIPLARLLLPAVTRVMQANARMERRLAALRTVEALRGEAKDRGGWPKSLADLAVPVPLDPGTGKPFEYRVENDVAILHGPRRDEQASFELYYRLKLK